jgi:hypothetical protein
VNDVLAHATWMPRELVGDPVCDPGERSMTFRVHDQLVFTTSCTTVADQETATAIIEIFATVNLARGG